MISTWSEWKRYPRPGRGENIEAPISPGIYEVRYAGTGAYDDTAFGFTASPSNGHKNVGTEYDLVAAFTPHKAVTFEVGFEWLDGGAVFQTAADRNVGFGYVSLELRY